MRYPTDAEAQAFENIVRTQDKEELIEHMKQHQDVSWSECLDELPQPDRLWVLETLARQHLH